jgi:uncharacterized protein (DUF433 family)/transposase-like protein
VKTLWQVLGEQKAIIPPKEYWTPERVQTLKDAHAANKTVGETIRDHFPELSYKQVRSAKEKHGLKTTGGNNPIKRNFDSYWTPERKETLKTGMLSGKTDMQINTDHFPDRSLRQIVRAVKNFKGELGVGKRVVNQKHVGIPREPKIEKINTSKPNGEFDHDKFWTPENLEKLKTARANGLSNTQIRTTHFPHLSHEQMKYAIKKHSGSIGIEKRKLGNEPIEWTDEQKKKLKTVYSPDKTDKELSRDHFPDIKPEHISIAVRKYKNELGLPDKPKANQDVHRNFRAYWTDDKKYILKRAWNAGKPQVDIHLDHFPDIERSSFQRAVNVHAKEFGRNMKESGFKKRPGQLPVKEKYVAPVDDEARVRIIADLKKPGANISSVAKKHYAHESAVKRIDRVYNRPEKNKFLSAALIPDEHIAFAKELRGKKVLVQPSEIQRMNRWGNKARRFSAGSTIIAKALNSKFPGFNYHRRHVESLINNGTFALDSEKGPRTLSSQRQQINKDKRTIWKDHSSGKSVDDIVADNPHLTKDYVVRHIKKLTNMNQHHLIPVAGIKKESYSYLELNKIFMEMNDNEESNLKSWGDRVVHHEKKAKWHKKLYDQTPDTSSFKGMHKELADHHEHELNRARFQLRKQQIITGEN